MTFTLSRRHFALAAGSCLLGACLPDRPFKHRNTTVPEALDDGWEIGDPRQVGLDSGTLERIHEELLREDKHVGSLGMPIVKDGKLVWETYLHSVHDRDRTNHIQSLTKSVTSLAFGIARDDGLFPDLDATLETLLPLSLAGKASDKRDITLHHLMTMRSGIAFDNDVFSLELYVDKPRDPLRHILEKPRYAESGAEFYYRDADPQVLGYVLREKLRKTEEEFTRKRLFEPLGIQDYFWGTCPDGASMAAHGLHLKPRDLAKIGQLMLQQGTFLGRRVVSSDWCALATTAQVPRGPSGTKHADLEYGYYYWLVPEYGAFSGWGHGGQYVFVHPGQQLVIAKTALPDTDDLHGARLEDFVELVSPLLTST